MTKDDFLELQMISTWRLFFYSAITLGVYSGYYIKALSHKVNQLDNNLPAIHNTLVETLFVLCWLGPLSLVKEIWFKDQPIFVLADALLNWLGFILVVVWAFKVRNRINLTFDFAKTDHQFWFYGFWCFVFNSFYINYRLNHVCLWVRADQDTAAPPEDR
ncbi:MULTISPECIES: DUF4234 domain-containing protein [unclassified Agarivorans]|uniref:DUF4234 domain-containing protein n=1 Tax=unclassified Agarivorans TaxID=2636026 RepID=UPI003D7D6E32